MICVALGISFQLQECIERTIRLAPVPHPTVGMFHQFNYLWGCPWEGNKKNICMYAKNIYIHTYLYIYIYIYIKKIHEKLTGHLGFVDPIAVGSWNPKIRWKKKKTCKKNHRNGRYLSIFRNFAVRNRQKMTKKEMFFLTAELLRSRICLQDKIAYYTLWFLAVHRYIYIYLIYIYTSYIHIYILYT